MDSIFEGVRVIDFTANAAGPAATAALADLGADVIKIESPGKGDVTRSLYPRLDGQPFAFLWNNRGKRSVTLDLKDPEGLKIARELIRTADVLVENFRPGAMKRLGLSYEAVRELAPGIIYCSISTYGQYGPDAEAPGYDIMAQARSGIMDMTGEPEGNPTKVGFVLGDLVAAKDAFGAIAASLYRKLKTGKGQYIDVSMLESMTSLNLHMDQALAGLDPHRQGRLHQSLAPYGIYVGKNGQTAVIAAFVDEHWKILCEKVLKRPGLVTDERFALGSGRSKHRKEIAELLDSWLQGFDQIEDALKLLRAQGLACCRINSTREACSDPQLLAHQAFCELEAMPSMTHTDKFRLRGAWVKYSETPAVMTRPPELGEHNEEVLSALGYSEEQIAALEKRWIR